MIGFDRSALVARPPGANQNVKSRIVGIVRLITKVFRSFLSKVRNRQAQGLSRRIIAKADNNKAFCGRASAARG